MDTNTLTFIDVETTGLSPERDRIIEIGILRMRGGRIVKKFNSLVNPDCSLPPEITMLTGITGEQLMAAPPFSRIAEDVSDLLTDTVFVAHNARFDYSFVRAEFSRLDRTFTAPLLCTAKLSRRLFPRHRHHNLDSVIERFGITCDIRHRAFSDAKALADFYRLANKRFGESVIRDAIMHVTKTSSLPAAISRDMIHNLPETPGVYVFYGHDGQPLYIGKSINIRSRVLSHFYDFSRSTKEARIFQTIASIDTFPASGELGALLLESQMVKDMQPLYNRKLRKQNALIAVFREQTPEGYYTIREQAATTLTLDDIERVIAVFRTRGQMKTALIALAREYGLCQKLLGTEKSAGRCFGSQLGMCQGACTGSELPARYNMRFTQAFSKTSIRQWPFPGPITIREGASAHLVYKWCYLDTLRDASVGTLSETLSAASFDYDTYKILSSHLLRKAKMGDIRVLPQQNTPPSRDEDDIFA